MKSRQQRVLGNMPLVEKMNMWQVDEERLDDPATVASAAAQVPPDTPLRDDGQLSDDSNSNSGLDSPNVSTYQDIVTKSCAYQWLLARLLREVHSTSLGHNCILFISTQIRQRLDARPELQKVPISSQTGPAICKMVFCSEWDPVAFVREQEYPDEPGEAIEGAIILTEGADQDTEAMTCSEYMRRTWPLLGEDVMKLIKDVVRSDLDQKFSGMQADITFASFHTD